MIYLNKTQNKLEYTENKSEQYLQAFLCELALFKGENMMDSEAGIDYIKVLNGEVFLKQEVERVISKYSKYFEILESGETEILKEKEEKVAISINIKKFGDEKLNSVLLEVPNV